MWHDSFASSTLLLLFAAARHDLFICVTTYSHATWLICLIHVIVTLCCCVTWFIYMWDDIFTCDRTHLHHPRYCYSLLLTWPIHVCHDIFTCDKTHLSHPRYYYSLLLCDMAYSYASWLNHMWHALLICVMTWLYVTWRICRINVIVALRICLHICIVWLIHKWNESWMRDRTDLPHSYGLC